MDDNMGDAPACAETRLCLQISATANAEIRSQRTELMRGAVHRAWQEPLLEVGASNLVSLEVRSCIEIGTVPQQDRSMRGSSCDHFRRTSLR